MGLFTVLSITESYLKSRIWLIAADDPAMKAMPKKPVKALMISMLKLVAKTIDAPAVIIKRYKTPGFVKLKYSFMVRLMRCLL